MRVQHFCDCLGSDSSASKDGLEDLNRLFSSVLFLFRRAFGCLALAGTAEIAKNRIPVIFIALFPPRPCDCSSCRLRMCRQRATPSFFHMDRKFRIRNTSQISRVCDLAALVPIRRANLQLDQCRSRWRWHYRQFGFQSARLGIMRRKHHRIIVQEQTN